MAVGCTEALEDRAFTSGVLVDHYPDAPVCYFGYCLLKDILVPFKLYNKATIFLG